MVTLKGHHHLCERSVTMKIYLFNPETGFYLGEDFADDPPMCEGRCAVPSDATTIPPPAYGPGAVPVYSVIKNRWEIVSTVLPFNSMPSPAPHPHTDLPLG